MLLRVTAPLVMVAALVLTASLPAPATAGGADDNRTLAFPGAEGYGRFAKGGRGGDVYTVTNVDDHGAGSLRHGIETVVGPRTIVFAVSGTIALDTPLEIRDISRLTIAGQTAPGDGIALRGRKLSVRDVSDVIIRYIRTRLGDETGASADTITVGGAQNTIFDHLTATWGVDGIMDTRRLDAFTLQWSIFAEALHESTHTKGGHAMLSSFRDTTGNVTIHHNLLASSRNRHPTLGGGSKHNPRAVFDFRNNIIYNAEGKTNLAHGRFALIGNYYRPGPNTDLALYPIGPKTVDEDATFGTLEGNVFERHADWTQDNYLAVEWGVRGGNYPAEVTRAEFTLPAQPVARADRPATDTADEAYERVLDAAGASLRRDSADARLIEGVRTRTHRRIDSQSDVGGWPVLAMGVASPDTDGDGMPDAWESANGFDPADGHDRNGDADDDGYTNLEEYLNSLCVQ